MLSAWGRPARGVSIRWDEAVAFLQEIVDTAIEAGGDNAPIPGFDDVLIDGEGRWHSRALAVESGPAAAGRALHTLLATADIPVPLRLFVTQANALLKRTSRSRRSKEGLLRQARAQRADPGHLRALSLVAGGSSNSPFVPPPLPERPDVAGGAAAWASEMAHASRGRPLHREFRRGDLVWARQHRHCRICCHEGEGGHRYRGSDDQERAWIGDERNAHDSGGAACRSKRGSHQPRVLASKRRQLPVWIVETAREKNRSSHW